MNSIQVRSIDIDHELSRDYLALKYIVFVDELGWQLPLSQYPGLVAVDAYDHFSSLFIAYSASAKPVGIIRATPIQRVFPYRELLERHLAPKKISVAVEKLCVLTSLVVLPTFRGKSVTYRGQQITAAKALLWTAVDELRKTGFETCLLTAVEGVSAEFLERSGAYPLSEQYYLPKFTDNVRDFAILVNDCKRFEETNSYLSITCNEQALNSDELATRRFLKNLYTG